MRFVDFLRTAVLLFAASATALAVVAFAGAKADDDSRLVLIALGWWTAAAIVGAVIGRRMVATQGIAQLLASARTTPLLPEVDPGRVLFSRLWLLAALTLVAGGLAFLIPQVPAVATGFPLLAALAWRRQSAAVAAIEERDGVRFYVEPGAFTEPTKLIRTPGFRKLEDRREPLRSVG